MARHVDRRGPRRIAADGGSHRFSANGRRCPVPRKQISSASDGGWPASSRGSTTFLFRSQCTETQTSPEPLRCQ